MKERQEHICSQCNKKFYARRKIFRNKNNQTFCSSECSDQFHSKVKIKPSIDDVIAMLNNGWAYEKIGGIFNVSGNAVKKWIKKAGLECPKKQHESVTIRCTYCGKIKKRQYNAVIGKNNNFCSKECQHAFDRLNGPLAGVTKADIESRLAVMSLRAVARYYGVNHSTIKKRFDV